MCHRMCLNALMFMVLPLSACDCGITSNLVIMDSGIDSGVLPEDGGPLDSSGAPDGSPDTCGTLPCCDPSELPAIGEVGLLVLDVRTVAFEPAVDGALSETVIWQGSTESGGLTDLSFLMPSGETQHVRLPVVEAPALALGTNVHLAIDNTPFDGLPGSQMRVVVSLSDVDSGVLYAAYQTERPGSDDNFYFYLIDPLSFNDIHVARAVFCQGPEQYICNYQTEVFDMVFSSSDQSVRLGQGESGTLSLPDASYRVMNWQSLDNGGEATAKGSCGLLFGVRSFDIVRLP